MKLCTKKSPDVYVHVTTNNRISENKQLCRKSEPKKKLEKCPHTDYSLVVLACSQLIFSEITQ